MAVKVGQPAPGFETRAYINGEIKDIKLAGYRGKWVMLYFYAGDFTFVCPTELTAVAAKYEDIKALGAEVLAISIDSPYTRKVWQETVLAKMIPGGLPYPMLWDKAGSIGEAYDVYDKASGVDIRGHFLIDSDGVLQAMEVLAPAVGRNVAEMIRQIRACQYVRERPKEATFAGWEPGKKALKPGEELAGKVCDMWAPDMAF